MVNMLLTLGPLLMQHEFWEHQSAATRYKKAEHVENYRPRLKTHFKLARAQCKKHDHINTAMSSRHDKAAWPNKRQIVLESWQGKRWTIIVFPPSKLSAKAQHASNTLLTSFIYREKGRTVQLMCLVLAQLMACWGTATCLPAPQVHQTTLGGDGGRHTSKRPRYTYGPCCLEWSSGTFFFFKAASCLPQASCCFVQAGSPSP